MKRILILTAGLLIGTAALAYKDGTYNCKNIDGLPDNVYKITTQNVMGGGGLPYLEAHRFYKNQDGKVVEATIRGLASVVKTSSDPGDTLMVGYFRLEFDGDRPYNCK